MRRCATLGRRMGNSELRNGGGFGSARRDQLPRRLGEVVDRGFAGWSYRGRSGWPSMCTICPGLQVVPVASLKRPAISDA
jgi:hypothetical protein